MDLDGSQCPENSNSTDCLLRALLQALKEHQEADDAEVDWDPINFAFTLLIGLLAILFAVAAVLQAIFAAGKGRRRTSQLAIGDWSQKTTRRWDWSEMNFHFTASTPIFREESLPVMPTRSRTTMLTNNDHVDGEQDEGHISQEPTQSVVDSTESVLSIVHGTESSCTAVRSGFRGLWAQARNIASNLHSTQSRRPFAAWLDFFEEVGLHELDCQDWADSVREVAADYLPDDVVAAPAYAQIGAIVAAAAMAGIQRLDIDQQKYPILLGRGFQVDFRLHPALGVVGAYSRYEKKSEKSASLDLKELSLMIRYGRGIVKGEIPMDLSQASTRRQLIEGWNMNSRRLAFGENSIRKSIFPLNVATISEIHLPLIAGVSANTPTFVPMLFPTTTMGSSLSLLSLALNGKYWAEARLGRFSQSYILRWPESQGTPRWHNFKWFESSDSSMTPETQQLYGELDRDEHRDLRRIELATAELKFEDLERAERDRRRAKADQEMIEQAIKRLQLKEPEEMEGGHRRREAVKELEARRAKPTPKPEAEPASATTAAAAKAKVSIANSQIQPREEAAVTSQTALREAKVPHQGIKVDHGHCVVLHMCLKLLQDPARLEDWFFEASPKGQKALRRLVLEQMRGVDQWLQKQQVDIQGRSNLLCNTAIVLLHAEKMFKDESSHASRGESNMGSIPQRQPGEEDSRNNSHWEQIDHNTAREIHRNTLQGLRKLVDNREKGQPEARELVKLLEVHRAWPPSRLWDRLSAVIVYHSEKESDWPLWDRFHEEKDNMEARDIDDIIIYRCLMVILLLRTATDSSKILESGLWDKVVPML